MGKLVILATALVAALLVVSCAKEQPAAPPATTTTPAAETAPSGAAKLFATNCAVCHGDKRQGMTGLGTALTPTSLAKLSDGEVKNTILKGKPNTAMAGFEGRLSSEDIDALVQFIKNTSP